MLLFLNNRSFFLNSSISNIKDTGVSHAVQQLYKVRLRLQQTRLGQSVLERYRQILSLSALAQSQGQFLDDKLILQYVFIIFGNIYIENVRTSCRCGVLVKMLNLRKNNFAFDSYDSPLDLVYAFSLDLKRQSIINHLFFMI